MSKDLVKRPVQSLIRLFQALNRPIPRRGILGALGALILRPVMALAKPLRRTQQMGDFLDFTHFVYQDMPLRHLRFDISCDGPLFLELSYANRTGPSYEI